MSHAGFDHAAAVLDPVAEVACRLGAAPGQPAHWPATTAAAVPLPQLRRNLISNQSFQFDRTTVSWR